MALTARHIDLADLRGTPAWEQLVDEVRKTNQPTIVRVDGEDAVEIRVARARAQRRGRTHRGLQPGDALEQLIGMADLDAADLAEQHDKYLAEAYADSHS